MKALIASLIIFGILLTVILLNCIYVNRTSRELVLQAKSIGTIYDDTATSNLESLKKRFKRNEELLLLSLSYVTVDKVDDCIDCAIAYANSDDEAGFQNAKALLINAIYDLSRLEKFSIKNIL